MEEEQSVISETDKALFRKLANKEKVDPARMQQLQQTTSLRTSLPSSSSSPSSPRKRSGRRDHTNDDNDSDDDEDSASGSEEEERSDSIDDSIDDEGDEGGSHATAASPPVFHMPRMPSGISDDATRQRKQQGLMLLNTRKALGKPLTREFTMDDSVDDIWLEVEGHRDLNQAIAQIRAYRVRLVIFMTLIELAFRRAGNTMMNGLVTSVSQNLSSYDDVFELFYRKYTRAGKQTSPHMMLAQLIATSMITQAVVNRCGTALPLLSTLMNVMGGSAGAAPGGTQQQQPPAASGIASMLSGLFSQPAQFPSATMHGVPAAAPHPAPPASPSSYFTRRSSSRKRSRRPTNDGSSSSSSSSPREMHKRAKHSHPPREAPLAVPDVDQYGPVVGNVMNMMQQQPGMVNSFMGVVGQMLQKKTPSIVKKQRLVPWAQHPVDEQQPQQPLQQPHQPPQPQDAGLNTQQQPTYRPMRFDAHTRQWKPAGAKDAAASVQVPHVPVNTNAAAAADAEDVHVNIGTVDVDDLSVFFQPTAAEKPAPVQVLPNIEVLDSSNDDGDNKDALPPATAAIVAADASQNATAAAMVAPVDKDSDSP